MPVDVMPLQPRGPWRRATTKPDARDEPIDRLAPPMRPAGLALLRQRWRDLLFLHWDVSPQVLDGVVPSGLTLDTFDGRAWIGLVALRVADTALPLLPALPGSSFPELNVRTYVHRRGRDPGVWFLSLDAESAPVVGLTRLLLNLPYRLASIRMERPRAPAPGLFGGPIRYTAVRAGRDGPTCAVTFAAHGPEHYARPGTLEHFLLERYALYVKNRGRLLQLRVHHAPFPLRDAAIDRLDQSLVEAAGLPQPTGTPLAHVSRGVDVDLFPPRRIDQGARALSRPRVVGWRSALRRIAVRP